MARTRGEESEMNNATGQMTPPPRAASTEYFRMDDDGDVLAARPTPLVEVRPLPGVLRHAAAHIEDIVPYVQILDVPVPQLGDRVVDLLREIDAPALVEQVIAVPKISLDRVPQRSVCRRARRAEQLVEVPTIVSYSSLQQRTAKQTVDIPVPLGRGDRGDRIQQCLWSRTLTFQFLMVVMDGSVMEAFKVSPRDRVPQRFVEQITLTLQFLNFVAALEVLKASSRVLLVLHPRTRLVPWMRLLLWFFALFPKSKKKCGVGSALGVGTGCGL